jgi:hypothetical protein
MQLSEAIIWKGIDEGNVKLNKIGTAYGKYNLPSHNMAIGIGFLLCVMFNLKRQVGWTDYIPLMIGVIFYIIVTEVIYTREKYPDVSYPANKSCLGVDRSCQNSENRLLWPYPHTWYGISFLISLTLAVILVKPLGSKILIMSAFAISFLLSLYVYPKTIGSVWCFAAACLAPVIVIANYFITKNVKNIVS